MAPPFLVIRPARGCVEAWSTARLPFEPQGWAVDLRAELREALGAIAPNVGSACSVAATYTSVDPFPVDAENVLLYNVGTRWFGRPSALRIERAARTPPPPPVPLTGPARHHHRYEVGDTMPIAVWRSIGVAAEWDTGAIPSGTPKTPCSGATVTGEAGVSWPTPRRCGPRCEPATIGGGHRER